MSQQLLAGKTVLVMGVANQRSIAWAIAVNAARQGARVAVTYQNERLLKRVEALADEIELLATIPCDVADDASIAACFEELRSHCDTLDVLVHSIAFANKEDLEGSFLDTSRSGYALAQDISVYSLIAVARAAKPMMRDGGSIITISFQGGDRVFPNYNVMGVAKAALESSVRYLANDLGPHGIRVNAISAGPLKTLASSAVRGISSMQQAMSERAPLRRNITADEVAGAAVFLASDLSTGITGSTLYVDAGYNIMGI